jgi:hypothetical protein
VPLYEVELRGVDVEERLTDRPLTVGDTVRIRSRDSVVVRTTPARGDARDLCFVCVPADAKPVAA